MEYDRSYRKLDRPLTWKERAAFVALSPVIAVAWIILRSSKTARAKYREMMKMEFGQEFGGGGRE